MSSETFMVSHFAGARKGWESARSCALEPDTGAGRDDAKTVAMFRISLSTNLSGFLNAIGRAVNSRDA
jgi:hypothetical protein